MDPAINELVSGYMQKAEKKLEVAQRLMESGDFEDAVSRAYYSVFHSAQALLLTEGQTADTHKGLVTLFGLLFVKTGKMSRKSGKYLSNLKDDRERGDYEVLAYIDSETANAAMAGAKEFLMEAKEYLQRKGFIREGFSV